MTRRTPYKIRFRTGHTASKPRLREPEGQPGRVAIGRSSNSAKGERIYLRTTRERSLALLQTRAHDGGARVRAAGRNVLPIHHPLNIRRESEAGDRESGGGGGQTGGGGNVENIPPLWTSYPYV
eukprot:5402613-Pleurochrysis_carterae.AAC.4